MRKYILLLMLLFSVNFVLAATVQHGEIRLEVINKPPTVTSLEILPEEPYYDDTLECQPEVDDESPDSVIFSYNWYVNGELQGSKSKIFSDFNEKDVVKCSVAPTDSEGLEGNGATTETQILVAPAHVKALKPALSMAGIDVSAREITKSTNMVAITGMATGYRESNSVTLFFMLSVFTLILISINLLGLVITLKRRFKSPKQGSQNA